jgi:hypothetical protein
MGTTARSKRTGKRQSRAPAPGTPGKVAAGRNHGFDPSAASRYPARNPAVPARAAAPVVRPARQQYLLIFAGTLAEAQQVARETKWPGGAWCHVTRQEDVECRHPNNVVIHAVDGFFKDNPHYLTLQKNLMYRLRLYGVEATYV